MYTFDDMYISFSTLVYLDTVHSLLCDTEHQNTNVRFSYITVIDEQYDFII